MEQITIMTDIDKYRDSEFIEETFKFWFTDSDHIRSPFPTYIQQDLERNATELFLDWLQHLKTGAEKEVNDEIVAEKFEELIFETASGLVMTEDEKITILYPFLPRLDDKLKDNEKDGQESNIVNRAIIKDGDATYLKVTLKRLDNEEVWETEFELPA